MISIGDRKQLGSVIGSTPKTNPFAEQMLKSPFVRFIENGWPYAMLLEVMRMTDGLERLTSEVFYEGELKPGVTTPLFDETRTMSRDWKAKITKLYPALREEPEGLLYPVFFNIKAECQDELGGRQSNFNLYNIAAAIEHILWVVKSGIAKPYEIGIATPYGGQVDAYSIVLDKVAKNMADVKDIQIGTSEWWQGKQAPYMVVDLVRATNDHGVLGFAKDSRRLNVLHSRQRQALIIFGDMDCTKSLSTDPIELQKFAQENRHLFQIFKWVQNKGRVVKIATEDLSQEFVELQKIAPEEEDPPAAPAPKDTEPGPAPFGDWGSSEAQPSAWNPTEWDSTKDTSDSNTTEWGVAGTWNSSYAENVTDEVYKRKWRGSRSDKEW